MLKITQNHIICNKFNTSHCNTSNEAQKTSWQNRLKSVRQRYENDRQRYEND